MTNEQNVRATWDTYASVWKESSLDKKREGLRACASARCTYRDPSAELHGHDALLDHMQAFHAQVPGGHFETTYFLAHHGRSIARWNMRGASGHILGDGISYGEYDESGKLLCMTGFFEAARPQ